jgi:hypothetical protein
MDPIEAGQVPRAEKCDPNLEKKVRKKKREDFIIIIFSMLKQANLNESISVNWLIKTEHSKSTQRATKQTSYLNCIIS